MAKGEIVDVEPGGLVSPLSGALSERGYTLPDDLSFEQWAAEGTTLVAMAKFSMLWLGDWLNYGEAKYGEKYQQAVQETGLALQTLRNAAWVCARIPPNERPVEIPFSHLRAVASLDRKPRAALLRRAEREHLTEMQLRIEVRKTKNPTTGVETHSAPTPFDRPDSREERLRQTMMRAAQILSDAVERESWEDARRASKMLDECLIDTYIGG